MTTPIVGPEPPDPLVAETRAFWRDMGRDMLRKSIGTIDDVAKQIIVVAGILEGLYFHAITFTELRSKLTDGGQLAIYLAPILLLLLSLSTALFLFLPDRHKINLHSSDDCHKVYEKVVTSKLLLLRVSSICLALGVAALFLAVMTYLQG